MAAGALLLLLPALAAAAGLKPLTAAIRVSGGELYDYVVIGEKEGATDGFDNAYDTISPGNLNADMGSSYVSAVIVHPDWKVAMKAFRGDVRAVAPRQVWRVTVTSSLPAGTPLAVALQPDRTRLPKEVKLTLRDEKTKKEIDLRSGAYTMAAPGAGNKAELIISAEQP